jgi:hypothetical protein
MILPRAYSKLREYGSSESSKAASSQEAIK